MRDETQDYLYKTLRSTVIVALCAVSVLVNFGLTWVVTPLLAGLALAVVLLLGWNGFIRWVMTAYRAQLGEGVKKKTRTQSAQKCFFVFALVKYPLVGLLIWFLTRIWDTKQLAVFTAGFILLQGIMGLRAVGKLLTEQS